MKKGYIAGGTMQKCPYSKDIEIVTYDKGNKYQCVHKPECSISPCPLQNHIDSMLAPESL